MWHAPLTPPLTTEGRGRVIARRGPRVGAARFVVSGAAPRLPKVMTWAQRAGHKNGPCRTQISFGHREWAKFCVRHTPNDFGRLFGRAEWRFSKSIIVPAGSRTNHLLSSPISHNTILPMLLTKPVHPTVANEFDEERRPHGETSNLTWVLWI